MRFNTICFWVCFFLHVCAFPLFASESNEERLVRVGYQPGFGIIEDASSVDLKGYGFSILERMTHYSDYNFEFFPYDLNDAIKALQNDEIDLLGPISSFRTNDEEFNFMDMPFAQTQIALVTTEEGTIYYDTPQFIDGKVVATYNNSPYTEVLDEYLQKHDIQVQYVYGTPSDYHEASADFYLVSTANSNFFDARTVLNLSVDELYFVTDKDNAALVEELTDVFYETLLHDGSLLPDLHFEYIANSNLTRRYLTLNESSMLSGTTFNVAYTIDHQPIQFQSAEGEPDGISIEIIDYLAEEYGFGVNYHPYDPTTIDPENDIRESMDILLSIQDDLEDLRDEFTLSDNYYRLPLVLFVGVEDLNFVLNPITSKRIGIYNYTTLDYEAIAEEFPNATIVRFNSINEAIFAYFNGEIDAGLFTSSGATFIQSLVGADDYQMIGTDLSLPLRIFISNDLPNEYVTYFNILFDHIPAEKIEEIFTRQTIDFLPDYTFTTFIIDYLPHLIIGSLLAIIAFLILMYFLYKKRRDDVLYAINHDELTGLISLYHFQNLAKEMLQGAKPREYEVIALDVDYYRVINSMYGYDVGTRTIIAIGEALKAGFSESKAIITRVTAEQFVILHKRNANEDIKYISAKYLLPAIKAILGEDYKVCMSVGSYTIRDTSEAVSICVDRANIARLKGKAFHRTTYKIFTDQMHKENEKKLEVVFRMEQAIKEKEFKIVYQPKIDFKSLTITGAEALVRWLPDEGASLYPDEFIPVFEANGFISTLDMYVFEQVCQFVANHKNSIELPTISVNFSGFTVLDVKTPLRIKLMLERYEVSPSSLEIEITESALIDDSKILSNKIEELKRMGFKVSLDDFGAGVSSLNRLSALNVDVIKLDKAFLDYNIDDTKGSVVVENVIRMAKQLNMKVVSEGIETKEQAIWLQSLDCDLAQGYHFERPLDDFAFINLIQANKVYLLD